MDVHIYESGQDISAGKAIGLCSGGLTRAIVGEASDFLAVNGQGLSGVSVTARIDNCDIR